MTTKKSNDNKTSITQLLQAGKQEAKNIQEIKSVAASPTEEEKPKASLPEITPPAPAAGETINKEEEPIIQQESSETSVQISKKGLAMLLSKREIKDSEAVKIPRELHRELKLLASMSGITMMQMLGNLIDNFLEENQKEIANYKKKYINGKIG